MKIDILLATYNGDQYLVEQLNSILEQTYQNWRLLVRDDLSTERTKEIIKKYLNTYPEKINLIDSNQRLGASQNFAKLLEISTSDYIMLCDQDDIWLPNKIEITLNKMQEMEKLYGKDSCLLVHTDLKVVDQNLNLIADSFWKYQNLNPDQGNCLSRLLVQNIITGCTGMINQPLKNLVVPIPSEAIMHDWWLGLVAVSFGKIGYLQVPTVLYRQHGNNDTGAKKWGLNYILNRLINLDIIRNYFEKTLCQSQKFLELFEDKLDPRNREIIQTYSEINSHNFWQKRFILLKHGYYQPTSLRNLGLFLVV